MTLGDFRALVAISGAIALSAVLLWALRRGAVALGLLDHPHGHKAHAGSVPVVGGLAVVTSWAVVTALAFGATIPPALSIGTLMLLIVGAIDDKVGLSARLRFAVQIAAALAMVYFGGVRLVDFGELLVPGRTAALGLASTFASVFSVVGVINALNMIDGMDGLSGAMSLVTLGAMGLLAEATGADGATLLLALAAGALLPFLMFNLRFGARPARVFLGDAGSMSLGFLIGWHTVSLSQGEHRAFAPVTALWLFAVPLVDTVSVMWRRLARGESPFAPDRHHVHHLLLAIGMPVNKALLVLIAIAVGMAGVGIGLERTETSEPLRFYAFLVLAFAYHFWAVARWREIRVAHGRS